MYSFHPVLRDFGCCFERFFFVFYPAFSFLLFSISLSFLYVIFISLSLYSPSFRYSFFYILYFSSFCLSKLFISLLWIFSLSLLILSAIPTISDFHPAIFLFYLCLLLPFIYLFRFAFYFHFFMFLSFSFYIFPFSFCAHSLCWVALLCLLHFLFFLHSSHRLLSFVFLSLSLHPNAYLFALNRITSLPKQRMKIIPLSNSRPTKKNKIKTIKKQKKISAFELFADLSCCFKTASCVILYLFISTFLWGFFYIKCCLRLLISRSSSMSFIIRKVSQKKKKIGFEKH